MTSLGLLEKLPKSVRALRLEDDRHKAVRIPGGLCFCGRAEYVAGLPERYGSPSPNGSSLPGGTPSSAMASSIATVM
jgi:hypothetical protein